MYHSQCGGLDRKTIIRLCTEGALNRSVHQNHIWVIVKENDTKIIRLYSLYQVQGFWFYHKKDEEQCISRYDCPLKFLDIAPEPNNYEYVKHFRDMVRAYHSDKKVNVSSIKKLELGRIVRLKDSIPNEFCITSLIPLLGSSSSGNIYKIPKNRIIAVF